MWTNWYFNGWYTFWVTIFGRFHEGHLGISSGSVPVRSTRGQQSGRCRLSVTASSSNSRFSKSAANWEEDVTQPRTQSSQHTIRLTAAVWDSNKTLTRVSIFTRKDASVCVQRIIGSAGEMLWKFILHPRLVYHEIPLGEGAKCRPSSETVVSVSLFLFLFWGFIMSFYILQTPGWCSPITIGTEPFPPDMHHRQDADGRV